MIVLPWTVAYQPDERDRDLCTDVRLALQRADLALKEAAYLTGVPLPKLSEQLSGKLPFTALIRLLTRLPETFWIELLAIRSARYGGTFVMQPELVSLIAAVRVIGAARSLKASLHHEERRIS